MGSRGIKDQVAIIGVGCTPFAEHWDSSLDDLIIDGAQATYASAGVTQDDIDAFWFGTSQSAASGLAMGGPLKIHGKPITRVENYCATGSEAMRQAAYAVASGAYDLAMTLGAEKVKDGGYQGLNAFPIPTDGTQRTLTAAAMFSLILPAYAAKYSIDEDDLRYAVAKIAEKNHYNGARNPLAQFRRETSAEQICRMAAVAGRLSVFDCAGVADGAAGAIMCRAEDAHKYCDDPLYIKALSCVAGTGAGSLDPDYDYTTLNESKWAADDAYSQAGVTDPRTEIAMAEVHDCFTPTELVLMEDLGFSDRGEAYRDVLDGAFALDGRLPVNTDGGLKSFGHPVGASGLRMLYEVWLQLRGAAPDDRKITAGDRTLGLTHNLGGYPGEMVSFVGIYGTELG
ncbi:MAG: acetyl-CoA acetyltransferase [Acidimicrobiaceae bacterium]|nr:acetyl-CoA acetyltransferase [Acidimicrobiaceae bacterium]MXW76961.1 acetyl-CoA acetyltransferase [Acidimicrobiaceae bacterium]MYA74314.1 acetyl-CoA acetyltransferase [Acidimicrobiaceae bacterium]MYC41676.1 acetyl-CoA acetyltransferase [Acidimicrobiaceae bacterium]MYD05624.1 acetyl-CoA acetyltransferase [Acidimicrobiaceae bacterium]